jgi:tRNA A37 threonylcarbamoyladenosine dehydratase
MHHMPLFERTHIIVGDAGLARLHRAHVFIAGLGGVGSFVAESLARMGVGRLTLVDHDRVAASNLNRQLPALHSTVGRRKTRVMAERIRDINPECEVLLVEEFLRPETMPEVLADGFDFVVDAIDSLNCKVGLIATAVQMGLPVAASMGAAGKLDPTRIVVGDLMDSEICTLARHMRKRLRKRGVGRGVLAVWSTEPPCPPLPPEPTGRGRDRVVNGTVSYMPALFGLTLGGAVIQRLLGEVG